MSVSLIVGLLMSPLSVGFATIELKVCVDEFILYRIEYNDDS